MSKIFYRVLICRDKLVFYVKWLFLQMVLWASQFKLFRTGYLYSTLVKAQYSSTGKHHFHQFMSLAVLQNMYVPIHLPHYGKGVLGFNKHLAVSSELRWLEYLRSAFRLFVNVLIMS